MATKKTLDKYLAELRRIEEHRTAGAEKQIRKIYKELLTDLNSFISTEYAKYAENGELTVAILQEKARYANFLSEVDKRLSDLTPDVSKTIQSTVKATYEAVYTGMVEAVKKSTDTQALAENLKGLSVRPEVMKRAIENPISGLTLPDVLEKNRKDTIYNIKQVLNIGLMNGDRYEDMARNLSDKLDMNYRKSVTIARTETHRVQEGGLLDCAMDISETLDDTELIYAATWHTMEDERVRPQRAAYKRKKGVKARKKYTAGLRSYIGSQYANHMKMNGVTIKVGDKFDLGNGVTATAPSQSGDAGNDINCRCYLEYNLMTVEEFEKATGKKTSKKVIENLSKNKIMDNLLDNDITSSVKILGVENTDNLNVAYNAIADLQEKYKFKKLYKINFEDLGESNARSCDSHLLINNKYINRTTKYKDNFKKNLLAEIEEYKTTIEELKDQPQAVEMLNKCVAKLEAKKQYARWSVSASAEDIQSAIKATITHEVGHIISDQNIGLINGKLANEKYEVDSTNELFKKCVLVKDVFNKAKKKGDIYKISAYAETDFMEFFAEAFAMYELGETLPTYILLMLKEVLL